MNHRQISEKEFSKAKNFNIHDAYKRMAVIAGYISRVDVLTNLEWLHVYRDGFRYKYKQLLRIQFNIKHGDDPRSYTDEWVNNYQSFIDEYFLLERMYASSLLDFQWDNLPHPNFKWALDDLDTAISKFKKPETPAPVLQVFPPPRQPPEDGELPEANVPF